MNHRRAFLSVLSLLILLPIVSRPQAASGPLWTPLEESPGLFHLDPTALSGLLAGAPREFTGAAREQEVVVSLPRPDGTLVRFRVEESPILSPAMTVKYGIRTYAARGLDEAGAIARFDVGPSGLHALVLAPSGSVVIRPDGETTDRYVSVPYDDDPLHKATGCVVEDLGLPGARRASEDLSLSNTAGTVSIYRLATSATGEFTAQNGHTVASALAAITTVVNGINAVYRRDFGIHLDLVDNTDQVILTQPNSLLPSGDLDCGDGPATCLQPDCLLTGNQCLLDGIIGSANYDVGVVFDATGPGGAAKGRATLNTVCSATMKGRGATGGPYIDLAAHEIGHMFGGHHTFNNGTSDSCGLAGQRDQNWAFEPGSGSTVMSYAGTCDSADLINSPRDLDFHADNVRDVLDFIQTGSGSTCVDHAFSGNYGPVIQSSPGTHTVPSSTPFDLKVDAYDPNGDPVTYSFDESDVGAASPPEGDDGTRPLYRVYRPTTAPHRSFPSYQYVLQNANVPPATLTCGTDTCLSGESLPTTSRTMEFSVILRDGVDGVTFTGATVVVDGTSGPFAVTQPVAGTLWTQGTQKMVTWNPAGTNSGAVNCQNVRILLSGDNGSTWPYVLAASTPNDGNELVTLPFEIIVSARIKVEALGNIFYDVSESFIIEPLLVNNTNDSGHGSLRQAIIDANDTPTGATIPFFIPGSGVRTIQVSSQLPAITKPLILDAWELGGPAYTGPPLLELAGGGCSEVAPGVPCDGLILQADNSNINGIVVRNFAGNGIVLRGAGAYASAVQNSYIGTDATGTTAAGNGKSGILIDGGYGQPAYGNFIGQNVISGNQVGVTINGAGANGNALVRNKIGTNAAGTARVSNLDDGVRIIGAPNTKVGEPGSGNVISGNGTVLNGFVNRYADAIDVSGVGATGTVIQGNIIGLDATGTTGIFNTAGEINVTNAPNTLIGGIISGARNVIGDDGTVNFHGAHGILVSGSGATGTVIRGNYIGTDATGTLDRGCRGAGVYIDGAPGVQIGGTTAAARNLISGNNDYGGVWTASGATGTVIQGNYIGTDVTGMLALGNYPHGVELQSGGNTIGGTATGAGNVISANGQRGIDIFDLGASNNVIQGNLIGTNATGSAALGNLTHGINITRSQNTLIGGTVPGARNVISGNGDHGIFVSGSSGLMAPGSVIQGNYIGTDVTGTVGIGNTIGIELSFVADATVGGSTPGAGNVISAGRAGNMGVRVSSFGLNTSGIVVQGNRIGTNAAGTAPLGNTGEGIWGSITGTASILGNLVAGSGLNGISLNQGSFTVKGNAIGTDATGTLDLRNTWSGISTTSPAPCVIGGIGPGEGNVVAFSSGSGTGTNFAGVKVEGAAAGQTIRGNRILSNTGLGIDVHFPGVTPNDACDADNGPNGLQNFPVLTAANQSGASTHVAGTLNSTAGTTFSVDFYANPSCDVYGNGEGATYLGSTSVTTSGSCAGSFDLLLPVPSSGVLTATATDPSGNTSEFSACRTIAPSPMAEVLGVGWTSKSALTWSAAPGATSYRVVRGDPASLPDLLDVDLDSCTRFTGTGLSTGPVLTENPTSAGIRLYWYLVVASDGTNDGPAGSATAGPRIINESGACP